MDLGPTQLIQDDLLVFLGTTIQTSTVFMHFLNIQIPKGDKVWEGQVLLFVETYYVPLDNSHLSKRLPNACSMLGALHVSACLNSQNIPSSSVLFLSPFHR